MTHPDCTCPDDGRRLDCPAHGGTHPSDHGVPAIVYPQPTAEELAARNLPAVPEVPPTYAQSQVPLSEAPSIALGFALGYAVARPQNAADFGPFCALVETLAQRFGARPNSSIPISEWAVLVSLLPPDMTKRIELLYGMQRGQRWAQTGQRHPK